MAENKYAIRQLTITNSSWTAVVAPIPCDAYSLVCLTDVVLIRSNQNDATTQDSLPIGAQEYVLATARSWPRWWVGDTILWLQAQTLASTTVTLKFVG